MSSIAFNLKLNQKKRRIYTLILVSTISTFALVIGFNYYLVEIRGSNGSLFFEISKQRSDSQILMNMFIAGVESDSSLTILKAKTYVWENENKIFIEKIYEKNKNFGDKKVLNEETAKLDSTSTKIGVLTMSLKNHSAISLHLKELVKLHENYISALNTLSRINFATYANELNRLIIIITTIVFISLILFAYLFVFQIRPLFDQIFHKNEELRKISSKQSHIYRAPLANILGLLYLIENSETIDETLEYVRLIKLNAEAMDERIHKVVEHAEQLFEFDGKSSESLNELIVMDKGVVLK